MGRARKSSRKPKVPSPPRKGKGKKRGSSISDRRLKRFRRRVKDKSRSRERGRLRPPMGCPDPSMLILMADGSEKKAGDLVVGDLIKTYHENTFELDDYKVEYVNILENVEKIKFTFEDKVIICSRTHKFRVGDSWKEANDMVVGDEVSGKKLSTIEKAEDGDVVHITVESAHTYICEGLLSHNKRRRPQEEGRLRPPMGCPDPNMHILMADGSQKKAGDLVVGDLIKTNHEDTLESGEYKIEYIGVLNNRPKTKLIFDGSQIVCSLTHKFYVDNDWKEAKDMVIGDEVSGKKLISIESAEDGDVIHITVEDAHTYICEGLLSHNKRRRPKGSRRRRTGKKRRVFKRPRKEALEKAKKVKATRGAPEREVPIPKERKERITRESDPRGRAPFAPSDREGLRGKVRERMTERFDERRQERSMRREERGAVRDSLRSESALRRSEEARPGDERYKGGRRDFTRRFSDAEGGRRGRRAREMSEFRDRYVSTLR
mgnify:FL=1|tara:strand:- start:17 stop:1486 length:1470 start_codon:yes stop_codon:yes gene_type:complete